MYLEPGFGGFAIWSIVVFIIIIAIILWKIIDFFEARTKIKEVTKTIFFSIVGVLIGFFAGAFIGGVVGVGVIGYVLPIVVGGLIGLAVGISKGRASAVVGKIRGGDLCDKCQNIRFGRDNSSIMSEAVESGNAGNNMAAKIMYQALLPHLEQGRNNCTGNCVSKLRQAIQSL